jgi:zinc/manganese transport system substrate-binding protein/manganese/iron transport system substrate-binding protein
VIGRARLLALLAGLAACLAGCGGEGDGDPPADERISVVATTTVLADLVAQVGGEHVSVESLVPQGGEVHTFDPSPGDVARVAAADLVVGNGLGLDGWLEGLVRGAGGHAAIVELAASVDSSDYLVDEGRPNPHLWLDPGFAAAYGRAIGEALGGVDPRRSASFQAAAEAYATRLGAVEDELHGRLDAIPTERRRIVSFHDAFPYFARAFDLELVGTILEAPGQDPSAGELAALIDDIRASGAVAVVSEVQFSADLAQTVAEETGARVVEDLYTDTLGDPPVDTYEGLLRWDVDRLVEVLRP